MTAAVTLAQLASSGAISADTSGNVGIGTTTPGTKLDVSGDAIRIQRSVNPIYYAYDTRDIAGAAGYWQFQSNGGSSGTVQANIYMAQASTGSQGGYMGFGTNGGSGNTERMRIDQTGGVRIKTTANIFNGPVNEALTVDNGTNGNACTFSTNATGGFPVVYMRHQVAGSQNQIIFYSSAGVAGSITSNGLTASYNSASDYRLKENVQPMVGALDKLAQLKPCTYTWKHDGSDGQGFIAHELQAVVPDCVNGEKDAVDADGNPTYQGVDTSYLVATLTAAIQELKAELDVCKAEIAALKGV